MKDKSIAKENRIEKIKTICIIILSVILLVYLVMGINSITKGGKIGFFSLRLFIMSSDSAEASTSAGDLVVANKTRINKLKSNENIIYKHNNSMVIKKIEKIENENSDINIYVKSTQNNKKNAINENYEKIQNDDIMGKVLFKIKGIGNIAIFIKSPLGTLNLLVILLCIFIIIKKMIERDKEEKTDDSEKSK